MGRPNNMALDKKYTPEHNAKRGNRYTTEQKLQCLMVLQANRFSLNKTAEQTGVSDMTLKNWLGIYGPELFGNAAEAKIQGETEEMKGMLPAFQAQIDKDQLSFLTLAHEVKLKALRILEQKLKRTNNVTSLVFIIKTLDRATLDAQKYIPDPNKQGGNVTVNKSLNLFNTIHNRYSLANPDQDTTDE